MVSAAQMRARREFTRRAKAGTLRKGSKLSKSVRRAARKVRRVARKSRRKVSRMARRSRSRRRGGSRKRMNIPILGILLGLGMADAATGGGVQRLVRGDVRGFGQSLAGAVANPGPAVTATLPWAAGLTGYAIVKRGFRPGVNVGPIRIAA